MRKRKYNDIIKRAIRLMKKKINNELFYTLVEQFRVDDSKSLKQGNDRRQHVHIASRLKQKHCKMAVVKRK
jgi:hypothetical protein